MTLSLDLKALLRRLSPYCRRALETAAGACVSRSNYEVGVEHVLLVLVEDSDRDFQAILRHAGIEPSRARKGIQESLEQLKTGNPGKPVFSTQLIEWIEEAWLIASVELGLGEIRSGVLIAALVANPARYGFGPYMEALEEIDAQDLRQNLLDITEGSAEETATLGVDKKAPGGGKGEGAGERSADSALARFTTDLTARARAGEIDPVFCREREIRQMIDILGRRRKNNPIAVGEAGVGKSAVVEGLALKIVEGDVPEFLKNVDLLGLDLQLLQAGASVKGEFENRLKGVMDEVKASPKPLILFIDEVHTLIGAGGSAGTGDAANILKPALARGEMRTIAATTYSEYKKYIDKDAALARRFQLVQLDEPSPDQAVTIIRGLRDVYERAHGVYVRDDAVEAAARMSARYISGRQLPDKAIDVLDTASARVKLSVSGKPAVVDDCERAIATLEREQGALARDVEAGTREDDGRLEELAEAIAAKQAELERLTERWQREKGICERILEIRKQLAEARAAADAPPEETVDEDGGEPAPASAGAAAVEEVAGETEASAEPPASPEALQGELERLTGELEEVRAGSPLIWYEVSPEVVAQVISDWTGIPLGNMVKSEAQAILEFRQKLEDRIKGQDAAIEALDQGLRAAKAGLNNPGAPLGVFLFVGPSGVGKTETGIGVADLLFGGERFMTTINMSEFQEKHTVSRLIGSPPGYVGYGEGGRLTEAVRQRPYSVILLDEVEKADLEVMNLFYQVFDKGMLADGEGRQIDFKNTVIIMTSNLATDIITEMGMGSDVPPMEAVVDAIRPVLSAHFKPALVARMTVVPFMPLRHEMMQGIVRLKLDRVGKRLAASHKMEFAYSDKAVEQIAERCTEVETGARNIDQIINRTLLPQISTEILALMGEEDEEMPGRLDIDIGEDGGFTYSFS